LFRDAADLAAIGGDSSPHREILMTPHGDIIRGVMKVKKRLSQSGNHHDSDNPRNFFSVITIQ
jgi:hypothetical protein